MFTMMNVFVVIAVSFMGKSLELSEKQPCCDQNSVGVFVNI